MKKRVMIAVGCVSALVALTATADTEIVTVCQGMSGSVPVDLVPEAKSVSGAVTLTFATSWAEGAPAGAEAVVEVDDETLVCAASEYGTYVWTPPRTGTFSLKHKVFAGGEQVGDTLTATIVAGRIPGSAAVGPALDDAELVCSAESAAVRIDLTPGTRMSEGAEWLFASPEWGGWAEAPSPGAYCVVELDGEVVSSSAESVLIDWAPNVSGTYSFTHKVFSAGGTQIGETLTASFAYTEPAPPPPPPEPVLTIEGETLVAVDLNGCTKMSIPAAITRIARGVFDGCDESVFDTETLPGVRLVDGWAVGAADGVPADLVLEGVRGVADYAFFGSPVLRSVTVAEGVEHIGDFAFYGCASLSIVALSADAVDVGVEAFGGSSSLKNVYAASSLKGVVNTAAFLSSARMSYGTVVMALVSADCGGMGEVASGCGAYKGGQTASLRAAPARGNVFAGWYDGGGALVSRAAAHSYMVEAGRHSLLTAHFATKEQDADSLSIDVSDAVAAADGTFELDIGGRVTSISMPKVMVSGLPAGIKYDQATMNIAGKGTTPGVYTVKVTATNAARSGENAVVETFMLSVPNVVSDLFAAAGLDSEGAYVLQAGVPPSMDGIFGYAVAAGWKISVAGLPAGVSYDAKEAKLKGTASKEGRYTVTFTASKGSERQVATATMEVVFPTLSVTAAAYGDAAATGNVSGGGKYPVGKKVTLSARPAQGSVFVEWRDAEGTAVSRSASCQYVTTDSDKAFTAVFATAVEDARSLRLCLSPGAVGADGTYALDLSKCVTSLTTPKLSVKGLPAGLKYDAAKMTIGGRAVKPGIYRVTVAATNSTVKRATDATTATLEVVIPNLACSAMPGLLAATDAYGVVTAGVAFDPALVDCTAEAGWSVKVAGLPTGLKYDAATGTIKGVPTAKASSYTVTFTASRKGEPSQVATITLNVEALPIWATGSFAGYSFDDAAGAVVMPNGIVRSLTVSANGAISGKILSLGRTWTLSAPSFARVDGGAFVASVVAKSGGDVVLDEMRIEASAGLDGAPPVGVASGAGCIAWQNLWKRADAKAQMPLFKGSIAVCHPSGLAISFKKDGVVVFSGRIAGTSISGSSQLFHDGEGWRAAIYAPPKGAFAGIAEVLKVEISTDDSGVVDGVSIDVE